MQHKLLNRQEFIMDRAVVRTDRVSLVEILYAYVCMRTVTKTDPITIQSHSAVFNKTPMYT